MIDFKTLAKYVGKEKNTVAKFFSRKKLSIRNPADVKKYFDYLHAGKQWRESKYSAPHLAKYHFRKQRNLETFPKKITEQFSRSIFWDRPAESVLRKDFIRRVARYGMLEDVQKMLEIIPIEEIKKVYKNRNELLAEFRKPIIDN